MPQSVKVSVIVPVYNAQQHLEQCLDSILRQTLTDIEIICVDDGSTDASPDILKRYQDADSRVFVYRQNNRYAGAARNSGKSHASGKYLAFWDSDDYFDPEALEKMYKQCEKDGADICVCNCKEFWEDRQQEFVTKNRLHDKYIPQTIPFSRCTNPLHILDFTSSEPWNKLYLREFIENNGLDFQETRNCNDIYFVNSALCLAQKITVVREPLVCYRKNQTDSLLSTLSRRPLDPWKAWIRTREYLEQKNALPEQNFSNRIIGNIRHLLGFLTTWEAFRTTILYLQEEGLEKLSIREQEENYYYADWYPEFLRHLQKDTPEEFLAYYTHLSCVQRMDLASMNSIRIRRIQILKNTNASLKGRIAELKETTGNLRQKNKELKNKNISLEKELSSLKNDIPGLENQISALEDQISVLEKQNRNAENKLQELKASWSYRIGHQIMRGPDKIKKLFSH